ncbi:MAG: hypothetical protein K6G69_08535 [Lachnospiraceae bacterium]|nr:hypothetical protein [Lachnospiraceae bacterium]
MLIDVSVRTPQAFKQVCAYKPQKIYVPYDLFYTGKLKAEDITEAHLDHGCKIYLILPRIIRKRDKEYLDELGGFLCLGKADGVLAGSLDSVAYIKGLRDKLEGEFISINGEIKDYTPLFIDSDSLLYGFNRHSVDFISQYTNCQTASYELSIYELSELDDKKLIIPIYGYIPMMITANCVRKTAGNCKRAEISFDYGLVDRKNKTFPCITNCIHCYNEIFNTVPLSYHKQMYELIKNGFNEFRIDFTFEDEKTIGKILDHYINDMRAGEFPVSEYTTGHIQKGAL